MPIVLSVDLSDQAVDQLNLFVSPGERMAAQFPAKRIADLGDDLDFGRVIKLRIFELMHGVLVIDRVGWEMDEVGCIVAEQTGADQTAVFASAQNSPNPESSPARCSLPMSRLSAAALIS